MSLIGRHSDVLQQVPFYLRLVAFADFFADWELLPFNEDAASRFIDLRSQRIRIANTDLKIASIVLVYDATLLSRNLSDFQQVPDLKVAVIIGEGEPVWHDVLHDAADRYLRPTYRASLPASDTERRGLLDRLLALAQEHDDGPASLEEMIYSQSD